MTTMQTYDFILNKKKTFLEKDVRAIIKNSGYDPNSFTYQQLTEQKGWVATGDVAMYKTRLEQEAEKLGFDLTVESPIDAGAPATGLRRHRGAAATATQYVVTIQMTLDSAKALLDNGYVLYAFKVVRGNPKSGAPVVWFQTQEIGPGMQLRWTESYQAYTSSSEIVANGSVVATFSADIDLGQILEVGEGGGGPVREGGQEGAITIHNTIHKKFTCGISQSHSGGTMPICAFTLFGLNSDAIVPREKVLLLFATEQVNTSTVIEKSYGPCLLIDLTGATSREVKYDINGGWDWGQQSWGTGYDEGTALVPILIESPAT